MATKENRKTVIKLDEGGVSTIIAALRLFQRTYEYRDDEAIWADFPEIFSAEQFKFGKIVEPAPLRTDDIDDLCKQLSRWDVLELTVTEQCDLG
jgi:hypothetical protein